MATANSPRVELDAQRARLFEALGIVAVCRASLASKLDCNEEHVIDALKAASTIINNVAGALPALLTAEAPPHA